jgi:hypothetical protein
MALWGLFGRSARQARAQEFAERALTFASNLRDGLAGRSAYLDHALNHPETGYYAIIVGLTVADTAATLKWQPDSETPMDLLGRMVRSFEEINPHVRKNLAFHRDYLEAVDEEGRLGQSGLTIPQASGCWVLMAVSGGNSIDFNDNQVVEAGHILGEFIQRNFGSYWDGLE